jgi:FtsP/CotA-like multicopper oxidase with cupredoxin domain
MDVRRRAVEQHGGGTMARVSDMIRAVTDTVPDPFSTDTTGLPNSGQTEEVELRDGDAFDLSSAPVQARLGTATVRMLAYNGSIPGPTLRVAQGSEVTVNFTNNTELPTTVHWHGIRLDNEFDGVPRGAHRGMQAPIPTGGSFAYRLRFPDPGIYWYHPHVREDYGQELGLYGNILVEPSDPDYWAPVNRELLLVLDDILLKGSRVAPFGRASSNHTAMGRYGNLMLVNGRSGYDLRARRGEVVRLYLTNTANVRPFSFRIPGAQLKLVGGDGGRVEHERFVGDVLITPSERAVVDVLFSEAGIFRIEHRGPDVAWPLGTVTVDEPPVERSYQTEFATLRHSAELAAERSRLAVELERPPDKQLALVAVMPGMKHDGGGHADAAGPAEAAGIEWEDTMRLHNRMTTPHNMSWKLVEPETGAENGDIDWSFGVGDRVKLRIFNDPQSDHPMQHPFHIHGQRFLVIARDSAANDNLAWKDTVLVRAGETVDLVMEATNPGSWMAHCHIAEHLEAGMMLHFQVSG